MGFQQSRRQDIGQFAIPSDRLFQPKYYLNYGIQAMSFVQYLFTGRIQSIL